MARHTKPQLLHHLLDPPGRVIALEINQPLNRAILDGRERESDVGVKTISLLRLIIGLCRLGLIDLDNCRRWILE
jgi:hypothetical protein